MAAPRRLYVRLYLAFLGVLFVVVALSIATTVVFGRGPIHFFRQAPRFAEHLARALPPLDDPAALTRTLEQFHDELGIDAVAVDLRGTPLASAGSPIPTCSPPDSAGPAGCRATRSSARRSAPAAARPRKAS
jgi:hypothetical protein